MDIEEILKYMKKGKSIDDLFYDRVKQIKKVNPTMYKEFMETYDDIRAKRIKELEKYAY